MRFSYQPLVDLLGGNATTQAELLHTTPRTVQRWKREGLSREMAEDLADRVRSHPYELWPELREFDLEAMTRVCAADRCDETFTLHADGPGGHNRRFCSPVCRSRQAMREYRKTEEGRRKNRERTRRYKQEVAEAARRRAQRREEAA